MSKRIALWDNYKFALILTVVIGHMSLRFVGDSRTMSVVTMLIYTFHMPAFVFVSGLFSKRGINSDKPPFKRALSFVVICYFVRILTYVSNIAFGKICSFDLLSIKDVPWYMMAMAIWYMMTWAIRKIDSKYILIVSITMACFAGYMTGDTDFLCILRVVNFFPFFYAGYIIEPSKVDKASSKLWVRIVSLIGLCVFFLIFSKLGEDSTGIFPLLSGRRNYNALTFDPAWAPLAKLAYFVVVSLLIFATISVCPRKELPIISKWGQRSLQIYVFHRPVLYIMENAGLYAIIASIGRGWEWVMIALMLGVTFVLGLKIFEYPINYLFKPKERKLDAVTK